MELINAIQEFTQAVLLLLIVLWLAKIDRRTRTPEEHKTPSKPLIWPHKPIKETPEQIREKTIMENLENYMGDGKGQIKV